MTKTRVHTAHHNLHQVVRKLCTYVRTYILIMSLYEAIVCVNEEGV